MASAHHIYGSVTSYQVLQRDMSTNKAWIQSDNGTVAYSVGGPYTIGGAEHVMVGDVWVMAGQSNMRGNGFYNDPWDHDDAAQDDVTTVVKKYYQNLFNSSEAWQPLEHEPTHRLDKSIRQVDFNLSDPSRTEGYYKVRGVSPGLAFARAYDPDVPVGLLATAHGGTTLDEWAPAPPGNTTLYGAMLARLARIENQIAGVLWYQGESDATDTNSVDYQQRMEDWLMHLRNDLGRRQLPFVQVQIARHYKAGESDMAWSAVRNAQQNMVRQTTDVYRATVASLDAQMDDRIHLSLAGQTKVGHRLAHAAKLARDGKGLEATPVFANATLESYKVDGVDQGWATLTSLLLRFENVDAWKKVDRVFGFTLHAADGTSVPVVYKARIEGRHVRLYLTYEARNYKGDVFLYYGYGATPDVNLETVSGRGLLAFGPVKVPVA
ncbi:SGNH hydrolase-type esterase domain-containing protein [Syncephalastrum racemosum]|uniref:SGNH hydrolase-type esterase domain-containing protein n=1 Tax=Syncephalastrum racemosum TaxID=13706 RepID=A0A1X2H8D4_SYNRA|nr:SGNH hydrolase-type esterase domain-containing protein [Syncephalastrum racemosum]